MSPEMMILDQEARISEMGRTPTEPIPAAPLVNYYALVLLPEKDPQIKEYAGPREMAKALQAYSEKYEGRRVQIIPFTGKLLRITKPPFRFLYVPGFEEEYLPLFKVPEVSDEFDDDFCVATEPAGISKAENDYTERTIQLVDEYQAQFQADDEASAEAIPDDSDTQEELTPEG